MALLRHRGRGRGVHGVAAAAVHAADVSLHAAAAVVAAAGLHGRGRRTIPAAARTAAAVLT